VGQIFPTSKGNHPDFLVFGAAYMLVIIVEPLADLGVPAIAKTIHRLRGSLLVGQRLYDPA
jgi:predicted membrane protein